MNWVLLDSIDTISFPYHVFNLRGPLIDELTVAVIFGSGQFAGC